MTMWYSNSLPIDPLTESISPSLVSADTQLTDLIRTTVRSYPSGSLSFKINHLRSNAPHEHCSADVDNRPPPSYEEAVRALSVTSTRLPSYTEHMKQIHQQKNERPIQTPEDKESIPGGNRFMSSNAAQKRHCFQDVKSRHAHSLELPNYASRNDNIVVPQYTNKIQVPLFSGSRRHCSADNILLNENTSENLSNYFKPIDHPLCEVSIQCTAPADHQQMNIAAVISKRDSLNHKLSPNINIPQTDDDEDKRKTSMSQKDSRNTNANQNGVSTNATKTEHSNGPPPFSHLHSKYDPLKYRAENQRDSNKDWAQSLPDLSGPVLDALCPDLSPQHLEGSFKRHNNELNTSNPQLFRDTRNDIKVEHLLNFDQKTSIQFQNFNKPNPQTTTTPSQSTFIGNESEKTMHVECSTSVAGDMPFSSSFYDGQGDYTITQMSDNIKCYSSCNDEYNNCNTKYNICTDVYNSCSNEFSSCVLYEGVPCPEHETTVQCPDYSEQSNSVSASITHDPSSLLSSGSLISEVLECTELSVQDTQQWHSTLNSLLDGIQPTVPDLVVTDTLSSSDQHKTLSCQDQNGTVSSSDHHGTQSSQNQNGTLSSCTPSLLTVPADFLSESTMSLSPAGSSIPSPLTSLRSSFRRKRPHSISPMNSPMDCLDSIIRSSPNSLQFCGSEIPNGSYGHYLPRPPQPHNNNNRMTTNYNLCNEEKHSQNDVFLPNESRKQCLTYNTKTDNSVEVPSRETTDHSSSLPFLSPCGTNQSSVLLLPPVSGINQSFHLPQPTSSPANQSSDLPQPASNAASQSSVLQVPTSTGTNHLPQSATSANNHSLQLSLSTEDTTEDEDEVSPRWVCRWVDCNALFSDRGSLSRHIERAHVDQRKGDDFTCFWSACQRKYRAFNARYKLLIHMRVHSGEKPNKCAFPGCDKAFSRLENLKIHMRSHTGERPYVCVHSDCNKAFSNSSDRAKHQRTHLDAKPYVCSVPGCHKRYTDPSSLRKHIKNHNPREQLMAKRKASNCDGSNTQQKEASSGGGGGSTGGVVPGDVVRFSLRCHVLSRRPVELDESELLPELRLATQEDLEMWIT